MKVIRNFIKSLNKSKFTFLLLIFTGCTTTSFYKINREYGEKYELIVSPDRIHWTCENLQTEDVESYGFTIFTLDNKNTVANFVQGNRIGKEGCNKRDKEIKKILKAGKKIYLLGIGNLEDPREKREYKVFFPEHGVFHDNGRVLHFMAIYNEYNQCFDAYHDNGPPCPSNPLPGNIKPR